MKMESRGLVAWPAMTGTRLLAFVAVGRGDAGQGAERRENIQQITKRVPALAGGGAGSGEKQRFVRAVLVDVLLAEQAVAAAGQSVVT